MSSLRWSSLILARPGGGTEPHGRVVLRRSRLPARARAASRFSSTVAGWGWSSTVLKWVRRWGWAASSVGVMTLTLVPPTPPAGGARTPHAVVRFAASLHGGVGPVGGDADVVDDPGRAAEALVELRRQRGPVGRAAAAGAGRRPTATRSVPTPGRPRPRRGWRTRRRRPPRPRFRDLHLAKKLDDRFEATRAALAAGLIDVEKAGIIAAAVEALTAEYDDLPAGTREAAEAHLVDQAPGLRRPDAAGSWGSGCSRWSARRPPTRPRPRSWRRRRPRRGARRTCRSGTTGTAPAAGRSSCPPCTPSC